MFAIAVTATVIVLYKQLPAAVVGDEHADVPPMVVVTCMLDELPTADTTLTVGYAVDVVTLPARVKVAVYVDDVAAATRVLVIMRLMTSLSTTVNATTSGPDSVSVAVAVADCDADPNAVPEYQIGGGGPDVDALNDELVAVVTSVAVNAIVAVCEPPDVAL